MTHYIDTSAVLAILDARDIHHTSADRHWKELVEKNTTLICSNYTLLELLAITQNRLGLEAVKVFQEDILPLLTIEWVDESLHRTGMTSVLTAGRKALSLVDCVSFAVMHRHGIKAVFAFDKHFKEQGFHVIP